MYLSERVFVDAIRGEFQGIWVGEKITEVAESGTDIGIVRYPAVIGDRQIHIFSFYGLSGSVQFHNRMDLAYGDGNGKGTVGIEAASYRR